jgi:hypothetical protein
MFTTSSSVAVSTSRPTSPSILEVHQEEEEEMPESPAGIVRRLHDSLDAWKELSGLTEEVGEFVVKARVAVVKESRTRDHAQDTTAARDSKRQKLDDKKQKAPNSKNRPCDLKAPTSASMITATSAGNSANRPTITTPTAPYVSKIHRMAKLCARLLAAQKLFEKEITDALEEAEDLEIAVLSDNDVASSAE